MKSKKMHLSTDTICTDLLKVNNYVKDWSLNECERLLDVLKSIDSLDDIDKAKYEETFNLKELEKLILQNIRSSKKLSVLNFMDELESDEKILHSFLIVSDFICANYFDYKYNYKKSTCIRVSNFLSKVEKSDEFLATVVSLNIIFFIKLDKYFGKRKSHLFA